MSTEEKNKTDVTSTSDQPEETSKTSSDTDTPEDSVGIKPSQEPTKEESITQSANDVLNLEILNTLKAVRDELKQQRDINAKLKTELKEFKEEVKSQQPEQVQAIVKGHYEFTKLVQKMGHKTIADYKNYCRTVYDRINASIPTISELTNAKY